MINLKSIKKVHFVGIGGIGVSAVARMMLQEGKEVSGSDREETRIVTELKEKGAHISIGHNEANVSSGTDTVIFSIAVREDNPELRKARALGLSVFSYPEILGAISVSKFTIAVSGTHGKTTTTAMIAKILIDAGHSPTVIVGSLLKDGGSNFIAGEGNVFVVEACEYRRSFLHLEPNVLVITNIDDDHLDYYGDVAGVQKAFGEFVAKVGKGNHIITDTSNPLVVPVLQNSKAQVIDYTAINGDLLKLRVPGKHNLANAKAALGVAEVLNVRLGTALNALSNFKGKWRRFEYKGKMETGALLYDDYAHHPTEIRATLQAAKDFFKNKKLVVVFQPHLYSRTKLLLEEFSKSFGGVEKIIIAPIYAAREDESDVNSWLLAEKIKANNEDAIPMYTFNEIKEYLIAHTDENNVVFTMGAGDIYKVAEQLSMTNPSVNEPNI